MGKNRTKRLINGAIILTIAGLISKILSAFYRIPLQNLTGDFGFYVYQQIYPLIGTVIILSLYGFPVAISKLTVEMNTLNKHLSVKSFYLPIFLILMGINGAIFLIIYMLAPFFTTWIGDENLVHAYRMLAFSFLLIPFTSLLRGVFQGNEKMTPTAYSQIAEQIVRVALIIYASFLIASQKISVYTIGEVGALASIVGAIVATVVLIAFFLRERLFTTTKYTIPWRYYIRILFTFGMLAALNHMVLLIIQFADVLTLVPSLMDYGFSTVKAKEVKGVFDRGQPLIQIGTVLGSSLALALIPVITKERMQSQKDELYRSVQDALTFSFYLAAGATIGLVVIFPEINQLLFTDLTGTKPLQLLVTSVVLSSSAITASAILQSLGYVKQTALLVVLVFFIKLIFNTIFVPKWGIYGGALATVLSLLFFCCLTRWQLRRKLPQLKCGHLVNGQAFIIAGGGMMVYLFFIKYVATYISLSSRFSLFIYVLFIVLSGALIYLLLLLRYRAFTEKQLNALPLANVWISIYKKFHY